MNIVIVDITSVIPVKKYGGIERVIWGLGKELTKLGHKVTFLVKEGSFCPFANVLFYNSQKNIKLQIPENTDVIHFQSRITDHVDLPYILTIHGNIGVDSHTDKNAVFISKNHAERNGSNVYVYNGLDWEDYGKPNLNEKRDYLHFLGKTSWKIKNVFGACKIALKANHKLKVLGGKRWNYTNFKRGFKYTLNPNIIFEGMVDNNRKMEILKNSKALVFPVLWHEPFGLAIIESLYAGCAVFGTKYGSLNELITPEVGFTSNNLDEIPEAITNFNYNPKRCHEYAKNKFNSKNMVLNYIKLYEKVIAGETLHTEKPRYIKEKNEINK